MWRDALPDQLLHHKMLWKDTVGAWRCISSAPEDKEAHANRAWSPCWGRLWFPPVSFWPLLKVDSTESSFPCTLGCIVQLCLWPLRMSKSILWDGILLFPYFVQAIYTSPVASSKPCCLNPGSTQDAHTSAKADGASCCGNKRQRTCWPGGESRRQEMHT